MKNIFYTVILSFLTVMALSATGIQTDEGDKLLGIWEPSNGMSKIKIEKIGSKYSGKIVWLKIPDDPETNKPKLDKNNPDHTMKTNPLKGNRILKDFVYKKNNEWANGTIYDPKNGKTYSCIINMKDDNTIDIRGYVGIKTFGRTDTWKRVVTK